MHLLTAFPVTKKSSIHSTSGQILERKSVIERVADKIRLFIDTFIEGMGGSV